MLLIEKYLAAAIAFGVIGFRLYWIYCGCRAKIRDEQRCDVAQPSDVQTLFAKPSPHSTDESEIQTIFHEAGSDGVSQG